MCKERMCSCVKDRCGNRNGGGNICLTRIGKKVRGERLGRGCTRLRLDKRHL
jgi:hypothetical protein